jgi:hypothetical protein
MLISPVTAKPYFTHWNGSPKTLPRRPRQATIRCDSTNPPAKLLSRRDDPPLSMVDRQAPGIKNSNIVRPTVSQAAYPAPVRCQCTVHASAQSRVALSSAMAARLDGRFFIWVTPR